MQHFSEIIFFMNNCPNCRTELDENAKFCMECGTPIPQNKKCIQCGAELPLKAKFCFGCGAPQDEAAPASSSINMGDKNVIAGDVIGQKVAGDNVQSKIMGNVINNTFTDESKQVKRCHICGAMVPIIEAFFCPECNEFTCVNCYDKHKNLCTSCIPFVQKRNEEKYKETLKNILNEGVVNLEKRNELKNLQMQLGISDDRAAVLENEERGTHSKSSLSSYERISIDKATELFYEDGDTDSAFQLIDPIYQSHPFDEQILAVYLPLLIKKSNTLARQTIQKIQIDCFPKYLAELEIAIQEGSFDVAEKALHQGIASWRNNAITQHFEVLLYVNLWRFSGNEEYKNKAASLIKCDDVCNSKLESTFQRKTKALLSKIAGNNTEEFSTQYCKDNNIYTALFFGKFSMSKIIVGKKSYVKNIKTALDLIKPNGTILLEPGLYKEHFEITKKVKLIGSIDSIYEKNSKELPIIIIAPNESCKVNASSEIEGILFTQNENIYFEKIDHYIHQEKIDVMGNASTPALLIANSHMILNNVGILDFKQGLQVISNKTRITACLFFNGCQASKVCPGAEFVIDRTKIVDMSWGGISSTSIDENNNITHNGKIEVSNSELRMCIMSGIDIFGGTFSSLLKHCIMDKSEILIGGKGSAIIDSCDISGKKLNAITIDSSINATIHNCDIHNCRGAGIEISNPLISRDWLGNLNNINSTPISTSTVKITNCKIHDNSNGIVLDYRLYPGEISECEIFNHTESTFSFKGNDFYDYEVERMRGTAEALFNYGKQLRAETRTLRSKNNVHHNADDDLYEAINALF